jgi:hypothetical protein
MTIENIDNKAACKEFRKVVRQVYNGNSFYRGTEASIEKMLISGKSAYHSHSTVKSFLIREGISCAGKFVLIHDHLLPEYVQVSFFEAMEGLGDICSAIKSEAKKLFPDCDKIIVGLNGHLNYGAGILLNRFDEVPVFGMPYTPPYYPAYFKELEERKMVSFRFSVKGYIEWAKQYIPPNELHDIQIRCMNKKHIAEECKHYTRLNNKAFIRHPYWADRSEAEDLELFYPFRYLLNNENLIFVEHKGIPIAFFLWYPDFNQLVSTQRDLNLWDVIHFRAKYSIDTFRFTEIGILPEFQNSAIGFAMFIKAMPFIEKAGFTYCEGGFIFEENRSSIALAKRMLQRSFGVKPEPYREYAVYEGIL